MKPEQKLAALVVELEERIASWKLATKAEKEEVDALRDRISALAGEIESGQRSLLEEP